MTDGELKQSDVAAAGRLRESVARLKTELARIIVGQDETVDELIMAILARGHCLLVGVPGLAKTLLVSTLADTLSLSFKRIQFTPDLMPSDITGTEVIQDDPETGQRRFKFLKGPIFAHIILADEINRTPPKTQSALLEAMQERRVSVGGETYPMTDPFFVLATQNPLEQEGTYPLPEAQLDRFLFEIRVGYPSRDEELEIMKRMTAPFNAKVETVLTGEDILAFQELVRRMPVADHLFRYCREIVRSTRPKSSESHDFINEWLAWGAGPRASMYLILAAKAHALISGKSHVSWSDVDAIVKPVLRHRIILNFAAKAEGVLPDQVIERVVEATPKTESVGV